MPIDPKEAEKRLHANPYQVDPEARDVLVRTHGETKFKQMMLEAGKNRAADFKVTTQQTPYRQPAAAPAQPASLPPAHVDQTWETTLANAEQELTTNPIGASRASRDLLRRKWGEAEYQRRLQHALHASGQARIKVTPR
jgi:hypothetical protein